MRPSSFFMTAAVLAVAGCQPAQITKRDPEPLPLAVPINAVMVALVDFAADGVWRPAASEIALSDDQWLLAEQDAINLIASATLITTPGTGTSDAQWVEDADWRRWATEMRTVALEAKAAVDARDQETAWPGGRSARRALPGLSPEVQAWPSDDGGHEVPDLPEARRHTDAALMCLVLPGPGAADRCVCRTASIL